MERKRTNFFKIRYKIAPSRFSPFFSVIFFSSQTFFLCSIFSAAPSHNRAIFVRDDHPVLLKSDKRIRSVPLVTKRPSLLETQRVHKLLSTCLIRKYPEEEIAELMRKQKQLQEEQEKQTAKADEKKISQGKENERKEHSESESATLHLPN